MPLRLEDYALLSDTQTAALVGRNGSIDWVCFPRFDSAACFAALLGTQEHGRWLLAPRGPIKATRRRYRPGTLILETEHDTDEGTVRIIDFMPLRGQAPDIVRIVEGVTGEVPVAMELAIRFEYGKVVPWVRRAHGALLAVAGPDALAFYGDFPVRGRGLKTVGEVVVKPGQRVSSVLTWYPSHQSVPERLDPVAELSEATAWWRAWSDRCRYEGPYRQAVVDSMLVLKGLTFAPTGATIAAPTTSLPEWPGGVRNWDYRYCWLRDATLTLYALMRGGYTDEAAAWREWLLRAVAGDPAHLQIMYGAAGERRLPEYELNHLPGYEGSRPVRVGNAAAGQLQLDVYGEVMDALYQARRTGVGPDAWSWNLERRLLEVLESKWSLPDEGIWEVRGARRLFTHSKVMAWVAFDRAVRTVEQFRLTGPADRWRAVRDQIHAEICARGYDASRQTFTQAYGQPELDASLLLIPAVGFLPITDERVQGTVRAVERELVQDGLVLRYRTHASGAVDGLPEGEGSFLPCTFWLIDAYAMMGRQAEAKELFERMLALRNDVGLLAEEYDPVGRRQLGNFPQAFSHLSLVTSAYNVSPGLLASSRPRACGDS